MDNFGCRLYLELDTAASDFENLTHDWHSIWSRAFQEGRQPERGISSTSDFSSSAEQTHLLSDICQKYHHKRSGGQGGQGE